MRSKEKDQKKGEASSMAMIEHKNQPWKKGKAPQVRGGAVSE